MAYTDEWLLANYSRITQKSIMCYFISKLVLTIHYICEIDVYEIEIHMDFQIYILKISKIQIIILVWKFCSENITICADW